MVVRSFRLWKAGRRLWARYRLHRMEWARFHTPMEPPEEYRHLYRSMFELPAELRTAEGFRRRFRLARMRYAATWKGRESLEDPDSSILARELQPLVTAAMKDRLVAVQKAREIAGQQTQIIAKTSTDLTNLLRESGFTARVCVQEFVLGYREGVEEQQRAIEETDAEAWAPLQKQKVEDMARSLVNRAVDALGQDCSASERKG